MEDVLTRFGQDIIERLGGPLTLRFILQPLMATILGIRDGLIRARERRFADTAQKDGLSERRRSAMRATWRSIRSVFILAVALDTIYQIAILHWFYPGETFVVAVFVSLLPYLCVRSVVAASLNRDMRVNSPRQ